MKSILNAIHFVVVGNLCIREIRCACNNQVVTFKTIQFYIREQSLNKINNRVIQWLIS